MMRDLLNLAWRKLQNGEKLVDVAAALQVSPSQLSTELTAAGRSVRVLRQKQKAKRLRQNSLPRWERTDHE